MQTDTMDIWLVPASATDSISPLGSGRKPSFAVLAGYVD